MGESVDDSWEASGVLVRYWHSGYYGCVGIMYNASISVLSTTTNSELHASSKRTEKGISKIDDILHCLYSCCYTLFLGVHAIHQTSHTTVQKLLQTFKPPSLQLRKHPHPEIQKVDIQSSILKSACEPTKISSTDSRKWGKWVCEGRKGGVQPRVV